jgi:predicted Zn-dependent protease
MPDDLKHQEDARRAMRAGARLRYRHLSPWGKAFRFLRRIEKQATIDEYERATLDALLEPINENERVLRYILAGPHGEPNS